VDLKVPVDVVVDLKVPVDVVVDLMVLVDAVVDLMVLVDMMKDLKDPTKDLIGQGVQDIGLRVLQNLDLT
jgi:hypothetical protein